jgi:hypothetical protein
MKHKVFISYSSKNTSDVSGVCEFLEKNSIPCFMAHRDIPKGIEWANIIPEAINSCDYFLVFHSNEYNESVEVEREIKIAIDNKKRIITYKLDDSRFAGAKEYYLTSINWIDTNEPNALNSLLNVLNSNFSHEPRITKSFAIDPKVFWFSGAFIVLFIAGFFHADWKSKRVKSIINTAADQVQASSNSQFVLYLMPDKIFAYDLVQHNVSTFTNDNQTRNQYLANGERMSVEAKVGYIGIGVLLSQAFKVKASGRNMVYYYIAVGVAIVGGYGIGYYVHERFFPVRNSSRMQKFLENPDNWIAIKKEIEFRNQYKLPAGLRNKYIQ